MYTNVYYVTCKTSCLSKSILNYSPDNFYIVGYHLHSEFIALLWKTFWMLQSQPDEEGFETPIFYSLPTLWISQQESPELMTKISCKLNLSEMECSTLRLILLHKEGKFTEEKEIGRVKNMESKLIHYMHRII